MSAVGSDAAFMLEKALEEMDDIFKDAERHTLTVTSHSPLSKQTTKGSPSRFVDSLKASFRAVEEFMDSNNYRYNSYDVEESRLFSYVRSLPCLQLFCQRFADSVRETPADDYTNQLRLIRREKDTYMAQTLKLTEQLKAADHNLANLRKVLAEERMNNLHTLRREAHHDTQSPEENGRDGELQRLRRHIELLREGQEPKSLPHEDATMHSLKARLREKASDVNRLKLMVEDLKSAHESKDSAFDQIQKEIAALKDENHQLRKAKQEESVIHHNGHGNGTVVSTSTNSVNDVEGKFSKKGSFGKGIFRRKGYRSSSEPNLASNDVRSAFQPVPPSPQMSTNGFGISHTDKRQFVNVPCPRGGMGNFHKLNRPVIYDKDQSCEHCKKYYRPTDDRQFGSWSVERVQDWLEEEGMGIYASQCGKVITRGEDLLRFTHIEMERLLGMANPLHQKKLILALQAVQSSSPDYMGRLDHSWIVRWLDDLGLPQYKDVFFENRVDGRVLHYLTVDDLFCMKIYNQLHHVSLRRAIQFLRHQRFHPQYLRENANVSEERSDHVMLWTNMRVMQWLRFVDLAEYAPNLRGSGVHGAVMILEPRFNAETLANLLSIPNNKSLLRRHLQDQFATLLSETSLKQKEMMERTPSFVPLNASDKHKGKKKGITFGSLRRKRSEHDLDQYLCRMDMDVSHSLSPPMPLNPDDLFEPSEDSFSPTLSIHGSESEDGAAVKSLGQFSQELTHLTSMLNNKS